MLLGIIPVGLKFTSWQKLVRKDFETQICSFVDALWQIQMCYLTRSSSSLLTAIPSLCVAALTTHADISSTMILNEHNRHDEYDTGRGRK